MDWFPPSKGADAPKKTKSFAPPCELTLAVKVLHRALKSGGRVFWRSAAMKPWYTEIFEEQGFQVEPISVRQLHTPSISDTETERTDSRSRLPKTY